MSQKTKAPLLGFLLRGGRYKLSKTGAPKVSFEDLLAEVYTEILQWVKLKDSSKVTHARVRDLVSSLENNSSEGKASNSFIKKSDKMVAACGIACAIHGSINPLKDAKEGNYAAEGPWMEHVNLEWSDIIRQLFDLLKIGQDGDGTGNNNSSSSSSSSSSISSISSSRSSSSTTISSSSSGSSSISCSS